MKDRPQLGRLRELLARQQQLHEELGAAERALATELDVLMLKELSAPAVDSTLTNGLSALLEVVAAASNENEAAEAIAGAAVDLLPGSAGAITVFADERLELAAAWDHSSPDALSRAELLERIAALPSERAVRLPLAALGLQVGELRAWPSEDSPHFEAAAGLLAAVAALGLGAQALRHRLTQRSVRDALTGLFNRRYMQDTLAREAYRARRHASPLGLILLDIDRFGAFNARYGKAAGDRAMQALAGLLQESFRGSDVCSRYSGQQFMILLPEASAQDTLRRAQELCALAKEVQISHGGEKLPGPSLSAGVAHYPLHGEQQDELLAASDGALYMAKQAGGGAAAMAEKLE